MGTSRRRFRFIAAVMTAAMLLVGCAGEPQPTPEELASEAVEARYRACERLATDITATMQSYIDQFAPADDEVDGAIGSSAPSAEDLQLAATRFRERRATIGCEAREFQLQLTVALQQLEGVGPVGRAVVAEVRDAVLAAPGPAATVRIAEGEDVLDAVHGAQAGATIELGPGRHVIDEPLVLLRGTTLRGDGSGTTSLVSSAEGAVLIHLGQDLLTMDGVTVVHEGDAVASVMVLSTGSYRLTDVVLTGGVADEDQASGWGLVLGGGGDLTLGPDGAGEPVQLVDRVQATGNGAGGVVVVGDRSPIITDLVATENASCGLCYLGSGAGTVDGAQLDGNDNGLTVAGSAAPVLTDVVANGNGTVGLLAQGDATPTLVDVTVVGNGQAGVGLQERASVTLTGGEVADHQDVNVLAEGEATLTATGVRLRGAKVGVLLREATTGMLTGLALEGIDEGGIVFGGDATGTVDGPSCSGTTIGVVLIERTTAAVLDAGSCSVVDQR